MIRTRRKRTVGWAMGLAALAMALVLGRMEDRAGGAFTIRPRRPGRAAGPGGRVPPGGRRTTRGTGSRRGRRRPPGGARPGEPDRPEAGRGARGRGPAPPAGGGPAPRGGGRAAARVERAEVWRDLAAPRPGPGDRGAARGAGRSSTRRSPRPAPSATTPSRSTSGPRCCSAGTALSVRGFPRGREAAEGQPVPAPGGRGPAPGPPGGGDAGGRGGAGAARAAAGRGPRGPARCWRRGPAPRRSRPSGPAWPGWRRRRATWRGSATGSGSPARWAGVIVTPRLREKVGQYLREGELICEVEAPEALEAEVAVGEQDAARVRPGSAGRAEGPVAPLRDVPGARRSDRPAAGKAEKADAQATLAVYCHLEDRGSRLRPGMTGHARIACGRKPIGEILFHSVLRVVRTEFWW